MEATNDIAQEDAMTTIADRAAEILAHTLGRSRFTGEMLLTAPDAVRMLGEPDGLVPRGRAELLALLRRRMRYAPAAAWRRPRARWNCASRCAT